MEFLHIYLLLAAAIACLTAIAITKVIHKTTLLPGNTPTFIQDYLRKLERNLDRSRTGITVQQFFVLQIGCPAILAFLSALISTDRSLMFVNSFGLEIVRKYTLSYLSDCTRDFNCTKACLASSILSGRAYFHGTIKIFL